MQQFLNHPLLLYKRMHQKLKKEAEEYFLKVPEIYEHHNSLTQAKQLNKFYVLLIAQYITTEELPKIIINLHESNALKPQMLMDAAWSFSLGLNEQSNSYQALAELVAEIDRKNIIDRKILLTSLPENLIDMANIARKINLLKKAQKAYTKFYYEQNKYSLLRENNEGYAKLSLLLLSINKNHAIETIWEKIQALIGNFDLDPDRVLDLLIEAFCYEKLTENHFELIFKFNKHSLTTILGNKLLKETSVDQSQSLTFAGSVENFQSSTPDELWKENGFVPRPSLIRLIALLVKKGHILLEQIFNYFAPADVILEKIQVKKLEAGKEKILKTFKMAMEEMDEKQKQEKKDEDNLIFLGQLLHSSKLAYLAECVRINDWANFKLLWNFYREKVDLLVYQPLLNELLNMLDWLIDPVFRKISIRSYFSIEEEKCEQYPYHDDVKTLQQVRSNFLSHEFFTQIMQILSYIGPYIGFKSALFGKVCRLLKKCLKAPEVMMENREIEVPQEEKKQIENMVKKIVKNILIPGISYQNENPTVANEAYSLLEEFEYKFRYECYLKVYTETMSNNPYISYIFESIKNKQNIIVNNLSKDNKKAFLKKMAKITHNQALQVFYWIFRRLVMEDYEAVVAEIVGALGNCTPLTLEMSMFVVMYCFIEQKQPALDFKTGQQKPWFKNLTIYISHFYRKYLETEIQPIFDYIFSKVGEPIRDLEDNEEIPGGGPLKLLDGLLKKVVGDFVLQQVNKSKYDLIAAGPRMNFEARILTKDIRDAKKSKVMLQNFFWKNNLDQSNTPSLALNLLVLLTQKRAEVLHKSYMSNIKLIGDVYDDFTTVIIQLIRVLNYQSGDDYSHYAKLFPQNPLHVLINEYKMPLEIAFEIVRPGVKHISLMNDTEWSNLTEDVEKVLGEYINSEDKLINGYEVNENLKKYLSVNYKKVEKMLPKSFFTTFWMLTLDSIYFPQKIYTDKIEDIKKKIQQNMPSKRSGDKSDRQLEKLKALFEKLTKEEEQQKKKMKDTINETKMSRFENDFIKNLSGEKNISNPIPQFAEVFVQVCLLPRMLLDASQALYCMKFTIEVIKANKLSSSKSIKLLTFIIEYVMNYLPYATERQASNCLAVFLSEILGIFTNWNDSTKLQQDIKKYVGIEENSIKDYFKLKEYILKLYQRVGNLVQSVKDQPYIIKNCLYMLQKVDSIPSYKQQADELEEHMKNLKELYINKVDMQTILERQITMINSKKASLPENQEPLKKLSQLESHHHEDTYTHKTPKKVQEARQIKPQSNPVMQNKTPVPPPPVQVNKEQKGNHSMEAERENQKEEKKEEKKDEKNERKEEGEKQVTMGGRFSDQPKIKTVGQKKIQNKKLQEQKAQKESNQKLMTESNKHQNMSHSQKNQEPRSLVEEEKRQKQQTTLQLKRKTNLEANQEEEGEPKKEEKILTVREMREKRISQQEKVHNQDKQKKTFPSQNLEISQPRIETKKNQKNYKQAKYNQEKSEANRYNRDHHRYEEGKHRYYHPKYKKQDYKEKSRNSEEGRRRDSKERMSRKQEKYERRHEKNRSRSRDRNRRYK